MNARLLVAGFVAASALGGSEAAGTVVRFSALPLGDGSVVPAHASASGDPSDAAAARRRAEIVRSPYVQVVERRALRGGEVLVGFEPGLDAETRAALLADVDALAAATFERDGWAKPYSARQPLTLLFVRRLPGDASGSETPAAAGWDGRDKFGFVRPLVAVEAGGRAAEAIRIDVAHQLALLSVRFTAPDEAAWAVEGLAEWLARTAAGYRSEPAVELDPFLDETGTLQSSDALAAFLEAVARRLPDGATSVRTAWEEAGGARGDDAEAFLRTLASRVDERGLPAVLADHIARRLAAPGADRRLGRDGSARRAIPSGEIVAAHPGALGFRRLSFRRTDELGGLEIAIPEGSACRAGRAVLFYRGAEGAFDAVRLHPGERETLPLASAETLSLVLVDGAGEGDLAVRLRRVAEWPATVVAASAERRDGSVAVTWRTSRHRDLLGWAVTRLEETEEGALVSVDRQMVPAADESDGPTSYHLVDRDAAADRRSRYRIVPLTRNGFLGEAVEVVVGPSAR